MDSFKTHLAKVDEISGSDLTTVISCVFEQLAVKNDVKGFYRIPSVFDCHEIPRISLVDYLNRYGVLVSIDCRIRTRTVCSNASLVLASIYIDRFIRCTPVLVDSLNVHRLLLTSIMIASKFIDDSFCSNEFYAEIGYVSLLGLNAMEASFLMAISFSLYVPNAVYSTYSEGFLNHLFNLMCSNSYLCWNEQSLYSNSQLAVYSPISMGEDGYRMGGVSIAANKLGVVVPVVSPMKPIIKKYVWNTHM